MSDSSHAYRQRAVAALGKFLDEAMADGRIDDSEARELKALASLAQSTLPELIATHFTDQVLASLRDAFSAATSDGQLSNSEWQALRQTAKTLGVSKEQVRSTIAKPATELLARLAIVVKRHSSSTPGIEQRFAKLAEELTGDPNAANALLGASTSVTARRAPPEGYASAGRGRRTIAKGSRVVVPLAAIGVVLTMVAATIFTRSPRMGRPSVDGETLTLREAKAWAEGTARVPLFRVSSLSDDVAEALARRKGSCDLYLDQCVAASDRAVASLSATIGTLSLGLKALSDRQAESLATHNGELFLNEVTTLTDKQAELLAKHKGWLWIAKVQSLTDRQAESLARHEGGLTLGGAVDVSEKAFGALATGHVKFSGKNTFSPARFRLLAQHHDVTNVLGVRVLTPEQAEAVAKTTGSLSLMSLEEMSDDVAEKLAAHEGELLLSGIRSVTTEQAKRLARHTGELQIGLDELSADQAHAISQHSGGLCFSSLRTLSDGAADGLANHSGELAFFRSWSMSDGIARAFANHRGGLYLPGVTSLSDQQVEALAKSDGALTLGVTSLTDAQAIALAKHVGRLILSEVKEITDQQAEALATHRGEVHLSGLEVFSAKAAATLKAAAAQRGRPEIELPESILK